MGFAACTNEVEEFTSQTQTKDYPGVELGEDFVINVTQSDFAADAETRAELEKDGIDWVASWNKGDTIGAAWFNKFKYDENGNIVDPKDVYTYLDEYGSNAAFVHQEGSMFKSEAISKLGAYVLYYPYNLDITDNMTEIPVKEIPATQEFDTKDVTAQVTKNITAASVAVFGKSSDVASDFTIEQIPNLYEVSFYIYDEAFLKLGDAAKISHVMLEADGGVAIFNTNGNIGPNTDNDKNTFEYEITAAEYKAGNMPKIVFVGDEATRTGRIIVEVKNADDEAYYINETGKDNASGKFYFSLLPTETVPSNVTFKVVAKVGTSTKVFEKEVPLSPAQKAEGGFGWKMNQTGQHINLVVGLDRVIDAEGIYSEEQFIEYWKAGAESFDIKVPGIDLSENTELDFTLPEGKAVTFQGLPITLPSISGSYIFKNNVEVKGNANLVDATVGASDNKATFAVTGNLTVEGSTFWGPVTVGDKNTEQIIISNLNSKSNVTFKQPLDITGDVVVEDGVLTVPSKTTIGGEVNVQAGNFVNKGAAIAKSLTIAKDANAELSGTWSVASISVNGNLKFSGTGTIATEKNGKPSLGKFTVSSTGSLTNTGGTIKKMGAFSVANAKDASASAVEIKAIIEEIGAITANREIKFIPAANAKNLETKITGNITANKPVTFGEYVIISEASTANVIAAADVEFKGTVNKIGDINGGTKKVDSEKIAIATIGKVTFAKANTGNILAGNDVTFNGEASTGDITADAKVTFNEKANTGAITANADVTFGGTAETGDITANSSNVKFVGQATTGAITAQKATVEGAKAANVEFAAKANVYGDVLAKASTIKFATANVYKTEGETTTYFDVKIQNEATVEAGSLNAKMITVADQYSTLTVTNKLDVNGTLTANGKVIAPVQAESTINDLTIEPGIIVDLSGAAAIATINTLNTKTKGEYDGVLLTSATHETNIGSGTNNGKIEGSKALNITGTFTLNDESEITNPVNVTGTFTIKENYTSKLTNKAGGKVVIENSASVTATTTTNAAANSGTIEVFGELYGTNNANGAIIDVKNGGKLKLSGDNINTSTKKGYIYVERGSTVDANTKNTNNVVYIWEGTNNPVDGTEAGQDITNIITQIAMNGATVEKMSDIPTNVNTLNISGTWTLPAATKVGNALDLNKYAINVTDNAEFTSTGKCYVKNAKVTVNTQKTLTVSDLFIFDANCVVELKKDAKFSGNKNSATVAYK